MTTDGKALTRFAFSTFTREGLYAINLLTTELNHRLSHAVSLQVTVFFLALTSDLSFSGITAAVLTRTLADVQTHLRTLILPSTILLGHSLESDTKCHKISHLRCIDTALIFHHLRGRPLKPGLAWLTRKWLRHIIQITGLAGTTPKRTCVYAYIHSKRRLRMVCHLPISPVATELTILPT
jgi:hypothetical protein